MVKIDTNQFQANNIQTSKNSEQGGFETQNQTKSNSQTQPNKGLFSLPPSLMSMVPWIPFALEAMTGQKVPPMGGTMAEIQSGIQTIQFNLSQVITNQQQIWTRLENLEKNAHSQFTNLAQAFQSFRLTHTREKKQIEYNNPRIEEESDEQY